MKNSQNKVQCGPFIACGAAAVSLDHEPGEPTSIDRFVAAIKNFGKSERPARDHAYASTQKHAF